MLAHDIQALGNKAKCRKIAATAPKLSDFEPALIGYDTEYDSVTGELLTVQFYSPDRGGTMVVVEPGEIFNGETLYDILRNHFDGEVPENPVLITYFSAAELQHLDIIREGENHREFPVGFMDCEIPIAGRVLRVYDLSRWFVHASLAKVAESYGLEKRKFDTTAVSRDSIDAPGFKEYAVHDAKICYEIYQQLSAAFKSVGVDILHDRTAASAAAAVFKSRLKYDFLGAQTTRRMQALRSYWGGRADVFQRGRFPAVTEYDLKSAYPSAAVSIGKFPAAKNWLEVKTTAGIDRYISGVCTVDFSFPESCLYPCLPVAAADCALIYPAAGRSHCTFDEMRVALEYGADIDIVEAYGYKTGRADLAEYMQWAIEERAKAAGPVGYMYKLLANSLIGKFAQRVDKVDTKQLFDIADEKGIDRYEILKMSQAELTILDIEPRLSIGSVWCPEWGALIMGRVRAELAGLMMQCTPLYCHTDSVWIEAAGAAPRPRWIPLDNKGTGAASIVRARLAGLWYENGDAPHIAHHSIWDRKLAEALLYYWDGQTVLTYEYTVEKPLRMRAAARRDMRAGQWDIYKLTCDTAFDHKRILGYDRITRPWPTVGDYDAFIRSI